MKIQIGSLLLQSKLQMYSKKHEFTFEANLCLAVVKICEMNSTYFINKSCLHRLHLN